MDAEWNEDDGPEKESGALTKTLPKDALRRQVQ